MLGFFVVKIMLAQYYLFICFFVVTHTAVLISSTTLVTDLRSFDELYSDGIEAYWNENWKSCIYYLERSMESYRLMNEGFKNCSVKCHQIRNLNEYPSLDVSFIIKKAVCLDTCEKEIFGRSGLFSRISQDILDVFHHKKYYVYLQYAYFRAGEYAKSVTAAYTYNIYDPEDTMMQKNMKYYLNNENTTQEMLVNLEISPHLAAYYLGTEAFHAEDFKDAVRHFETALDEFYSAEEGCRAMCEGEYDVGDQYPDDPAPFYKQIIYHYKAVLECYMSCPLETVRVSINSGIKNFVPRLFEYLYHAYNHLSDGQEKAVECAKAYLLFFPQSTLFKEKAEEVSVWNDVNARKDAVTFHRQLELQVALLKYIYQNFGIRNYDENLLRVYPTEDYEGEDAPETDPKKASLVHEDASNEEVDENEDSSFKTETPEEEDESDGYESMEEKREDIITSKDNYNERMKELEMKKLAEADEKEDVDISSLLGIHIGRQTVDSKYIVSIEDSSSLPAPPVPEGPVLFQSVLLANSTQMAGPLRFAVDDFAAEEECQTLIDLELTGGISGDGYQGKTSPHTSRELFQGITVHRAAQLAEKGEIPIGPALAYYELSERVRLQTKAYFKLKDELYFDYTHLVCRTALTDADGAAQEDNSHPIHSDNCILKEDATCVKEPPAYTWRDYSAIMYLNSNFIGGEFVMTDSSARRVILQVKPKCGRVVSFSAGKDCLHGVKPVTRGRRCAMALWFTLDPAHDEQLRRQAKRILDKLSSKLDL